MANAQSNGAGPVVVNRLVDQFGSFVPATNDAAWQPPSDPLADPSTTSVRAKRIDREIPNVSVEAGWTPPRIRAAIESLVIGNFDLPAQLQDAIAGDSRVQSAMHTRSSGLLGQPITFSPPKRFADDPVAKKCCRRWESHWAMMDAEPALLDLLETSSSLGFAYAQILWDTAGKTWYPYLQSWNPRYSYYHWMLRVHVAITMDGQTPITPGDAHWVLHAPYGQYRSWMRGSLRPVAQWWLARNYALRDWARYSERHGFPAVLADTPFGADPTSIQNFENQLQGMGQESIIQLPGSVDVTKFGKYDLRYLEPKDRNWQAFKELIVQCNTEITLSTLGQNLTSEVKEGSLAAAREHGDILQVWLQADARAEARTLYTQVLRPFAALNYGNPDYAPVPKRTVTPPEDMEVKAKTWLAFAQGLKAARDGGIKIKNIAKFARKFGLRPGDVEHLDPTQVTARLAAADPSDVESGTPGDDTNDDANEAPAKLPGKATF
jgi:phage gp29-like protein